VEETLEQLLEYCRQGNRVCPMPDLWNRLWKLLPGRERRGGGWNPPPPLILAAWHETTDQEKRARLALHLRWAEDHSMLGEVQQFLVALRDDQWLLGSTSDNV
jgi:hypothetical protein